MNIDNIVPSTLKVVANENLNIQTDLISPDSAKSIEQLLYDQKNQEKNSEETEETEENG